MKKAGVPVDERVAAIFAPMCPLLPTPVTMILPLQWKIMYTALSKLSSNCGMRSSSACASLRRHCSAHRRMLTAFSAMFVFL